MLLNSPALFMEMFNLLIENMALFKYVQDCSKYTTKKKKKSTMVENVINSRSITTIPNQTIFGDKSTSIRFFGRWRQRLAHTMNKFGNVVY